MQRRDAPRSLRRQAGYVAMGALLPRWFGRKKFNPRQLVAASEQGAWQSPSDFSTRYQDAAGGTPVTAVEQQAGTLLDKRLGAVRGVDVVINGGFTADTDWTKGAGWAISGGVASKVGGGGTQINAAVNPLTAGAWYEVTLDLISATGTLNLVLGSNFIGGISATPGPKRLIGQALTSGVLGFQGGSDYTIDNVVCRQIPGNHATQSTAASRPVVGARVNLLTKSEQFDDAAWGKTRSTVSANATTAPDGAATADKLLEDATTANTHYIATSAVTTVSGVSYKFSVYVKAAERAFCALYDGGAGKGKYFSLPADGTGAVLGDLVAAPTSGSIAYVGNGWYVASITFVAGATASPSVYISTAGNDFQYNGDVTKGIYLWGADLRTAGDAALAIPAYQRVNTSSDYDTVGFPVREKYDGFDDFVTTASGGGGTSGFFYCGAVTVSGGAGAARTIWSDRGANLGYRVTINASNQLELAAGNGAATTTVATVATLPVGETHILTAWDDGTNLNVQIDNGAIASAARPAVSAGTAAITEGRDNGVSSGYLNGALGSRIYRAGPPPSAGPRAATQRFIAKRSGVKL